VSTVPRTGCALAIAAILLFAAQAPAATTACVDADLQADPETELRVQEAIRCIVNEYRVAARLKPLSASTHLRRSATAHSRDMVTNHYLAHQGDGRPPLLTRVRRAGYFTGTATALFSENIGIAPMGGATARSLVRAWLLSPGHAANIYYPPFRDLGVGSTFAAPDSAFYPAHSAWVVTTDFGQRVMLSRSARRRATQARCGGRRFCQRRR
jgi:uncharacterized protein YkwD